MKFDLWDVCFLLGTAIVGTGLYLFDFRFAIVFVGAVLVRASWGRT